MKNMLHLLLATLLATQPAFAASTTDNNYDIGKTTSTANKTVTFQGPVKKKITSTQAGALSYDGNSLSVGDGANSAAKTITFNKGASSPAIRYNQTTGLLEFSNDGSNYLGIGSGSGAGGGINLLSELNLNPDFESGGVSQWTYSGSTGTAVSSGSNLLFGKGSALFTPTASAQYFRSALATTTYGLAGRPCAAVIYYKGGDTNYILKVLDSSSNVITQRVLAGASPTVSPFAVPYVCGAQGSQYQISIESTSASPAALALDRMYLGEYPLGTFADAVPTSVQTFTTSGTYTPSAGTRYVRIKLVGAGAGGQSGSTSPGDGTSATSTSYGSILVAGGGVRGTGGTAAGGTGGTCTTNSPAIVMAAIQGGAGQSGGAYSTAGTRFVGGMGGWSPWQAGPGINSTFQGGGQSGQNPGAGGQGGGNNAGAGNISGAGGGAGCFIDAVILNPSSTAITIGTKGTGGTGGLPGGDGANGLLVVEEYGYAGGLAVTPSGGGLNPGDITEGAWTTCPAGTIAADGSAVGRSTYAQLFAAIGTTYGIGNGSTTFNVPNMSGVFARGAGTQTIGSVTYTGTQGTSLNDTTKKNGLGLTDPGHSHNAIGNANGTDSVVGIDAGAASTTGSYSGIISSNTTGITLTSGDSETAPASISLKYCIRTLPGTPSPVLVGPFANMPASAVTGATYSVAPSDTIVDFDTTSNAIAATLPTAVGLRGKQIKLTKTNSGANVVTVSAQLGQTIGTVSSTKIFATHDTLEIVSDGANWRWVSGPDVTYRANQTATCTSSPCAAPTPAYASWITSVTRSGTGQYSMTIPSGVFSGTPFCQCSLLSANNATICTTTENSATSISIIGYAASTQSFVDVPWKISCVGAR